MARRNDIKRKVIITLSKTFPAGHKMAGEPTGFAGSLASGRKIHTVRSNDKHAWADRVADINSGKKYLSIRQWEERPYNSPQQEIATLDRVGLQNVTIIRAEPGKEPLCWVDKKQIPIKELANNDGLETDAFIDWFFGDGKTTIFEGVIVQFTNFRY